MSAPMPRSSTEIGRCGAIPRDSVVQHRLGRFRRRRKAARAGPAPPGRPEAARAAGACSTGGCPRPPSVRRSGRRRPCAQSRSTPDSVSKIGPGVVPPGTQRLARPSRRRKPPNSPAMTVGQRQHHHFAVGIFDELHSRDLPPAPPVAVHQHQRILGPGRSRIIGPGLVAPASQPWMIGSVQAQAASTSSPRMNSVWLPRITSMISRS